MVSFSDVWFVFGVNLGYNLSMFSAKETLKNIEPYSIDEFYPECDLKLDSNENIFGPAPSVIEAFNNLDLRRFNLYPCYGELLEKLSAKFCFKKESLMLTNGCDEAINVVLSTYLTADDTVLSFSPTFSMPVLYSKIIGSKFNQVEYTSKWYFSKDDLLSKLNDRVKFIYLATPNNPTGDIIAPSVIEEILNEVKDKLILLDLTYVNYSKFNETDYYSLVKKYKNLICVKSFSKDYGLAGLRLGFILADEDYIKEFRKIISPYSVNSLAVLAGIKSLDDNNAYFDYVKNEVKKSKAYLIKELSALGFEPYESEANFILVNFKEKADFIYRKLLCAGIIVRKFSSSNLQTCLRIGIPSFEDSKRIIEALKARNLLVFDLDGVVFDVSNSYRFAIQKTYEYFANCECTPEEMQEAKNRGGLSNDWDLTKYLLDKKGIKADYSKLVEIFQDIFYNPDKEGKKGAIDNEEVVLTAEFFNELSKKYDLAVFTGRPREEAFYSLKKYGLDKYFQYFVCLEDVPEGKSKPAPDGLLKIKKACYYNDICFFGDTVDDIKSGADANVKVYGIIPPNAANINETIKSLTKFGACGVIKKAEDILKTDLFQEKAKSEGREYANS